jgi:dTDP-glucose pyrophosphorylase
MWVDKNMNVLIPMAGAGKRFEKAGYNLPKPLIEVNGKPMIQVVVESLSIDANYIYIVQEEHYEKYNLEKTLKDITPNCEIIKINGVTEGAACTTLKALDFIDNDASLLIVNSDQFIKWNSSEFISSVNAGGYDGGILTFKSSDPNCSYAKVDDNNSVSEVAEKKPISDNATVGIYYWKKGLDYVRCAQQMIEKNIRTNNEFYVCPVYNEAITDGKNIKIFDIDEVWGLGTPDDLNHFLEEYNAIV